MTNLDYLKEYEILRNKLWNEKHILETRKIRVFDNVLKIEKEAFIDPINNEDYSSICLININLFSGFKTISKEEFNSEIYTILNYDELKNEIEELIK